MPLNVLRLGEWFLETARAKTRITLFARLMADASAASPEETSPSVAHEFISPPRMKIAILGGRPWMKKGG